MAEEPIKLGIGLDTSSVNQSLATIQAMIKERLGDAFDGNAFASNLIKSFANIKLPTEAIQEQMVRALTIDPGQGGVFSEISNNLEGLSEGFKAVGRIDIFQELANGIYTQAIPALNELQETLQVALKPNTDGSPVDITGASAGLQQMASIYSAIWEHLSKMDTVLTQIEQELQNAPTEGLEAVATSAEEATEQIEKLDEAVEAVDDVPEIEVPISDDLEDAEDTLDRIAQSEERIDAVFNLWNGSFLGIKTNFEALESGMHNILETGKKVASLTFGNLKKGATTLIGKFKQLGNTASHTVDNTTKKMKRMTLQMIKAGLGVRGLYMLFRKLRQAIKEGMDIMAKEVPEFNAVFSNFKTALNQIKGSIGTAFQPILQVVLPILTQLLGMLNTVIEAIARFNAVLMGQGYIYKFTAAQQDYAKKLKGTGSAAKKAAKDLMGFDEINRLSDKKDSGGAGDIGEYEKQMIDMQDAMSKFAQMVKDAWKSGDFSQVGKYIGEQLKSGLSQLQNWLDTDGQAWAEKLSKSLSSLINGLVDVEGLGYQLGSSIGSVLNMGITFLKDFWTDTNFTGIGEQVGGAINGLFDKVDWDGLGTYFGEKFNGIFEFIGGLATSTDWVNIGTSLAESLNTMIQTMDVGAAMQSVSQLLIGILQSGISFLTTTDFTTIGEKLADGLANIDWKGLLGNAGTLLTKGAQGILDMVIGFCKKTDWAKLTTDILDGIGQMFENVWDDGQLLQKLAEGFVQLFIGAFQILWNIGGWISDNIVDPMIDSLVQQFEDADTGSLGGDIIMGLLNGIVDGLTNIGTWLYDNVFLPIWNGIKDCFDIHSPSGKMLEIGLDLIAGLYDGLVGIWDSVKSIFDDLVANILGVFADLLVSLKEKWADIKEGAKEKWDDIKWAICNKVASIFQTVVNQFTNLKTKIGDTFRALKDAVILIWEGIWNGIKKVINWILGGVNDMISFLLGGINKVIQGLNGLSSARPDC